MTNIYNKKVTFPNGTLIGNWFEEDELKKRTGISRTIPGQHFKKKSFDFENELKNNFPRDNTYQRVIGEKEPQKNFRTFNGTYGDFQHPEEKYMQPPLKQKEQTALFTSYVQSSVDWRDDIHAQNEQWRIFDTTNRNVHVAQPFETRLGQRHMYTQEHLSIPAGRPDKLFMAEHKMGKYPTVISKAEANNYIDKYVPYYKDKEVTFWSTNLGKSNMYKSFTLGINPFGKSHAFTETVQRTKGATQFKGNNQNLSSSKHIYMNNHDVDYYETYKAEYEKQLIIPDLIPQIRKKVLDSCAKKGWIGWRALKIYLRSLTQNKSNDISRADFKYYTAKLGVMLTDSEIQYIYERFDKNSNSHINFIELLNSFRNVGLGRKSEIENFKAQVKTPGKKYISFAHLVEIIDTNYHPEVTNFIKTAKDVKHEYLINWDNLKEDDIITEENFAEFFYDVSVLFDDDNNFTQCLKSLGYK